MFFLYANQKHWIFISRIFCQAHIKTAHTRPHGSFPQSKQSQLHIVVLWTTCARLPADTNAQACRHTSERFTGKQLGARSEKWRHCCGKYCMMSQTDGSGSKFQKNSPRFSVFRSRSSLWQTASFSHTYAHAHAHSQVRDLSASAAAAAPLQFAHWAAPAHYYWWSF